MNAAPIENVLHRLRYSVWWVVRWPLYIIVCLLLFLAAWPWWVITGVNLFHQPKPPFKWMRNLYDSMGSCE